MGRLIRASELKTIGDFYVTSVRWGGGDCHVRFPNEEFSQMLSVHHEDIKKPSNKIKIRRFIDECLKGSVIMDVISRDYWFKYENSEAWDSNGFNVENTWYRFWFEYDTDVLLFKLEFSDIIKQIQKEHPSGDYPCNVKTRPMDEFGNYLEW